METIELKAEKREVVGKESSKKLRRAGRVPAVLYSGGESTAITIDGREFSTIAHSKAGTHVIVKLKIEGEKGETSAVIKSVQKNPLRDEYFNVDFQKIAMDEKISAMVPINIVGEAPGVKTGGGMLESQLWEIELEALPNDMPGRVDVDVSNLEVGGSVHAGDIQPPPGVTVLTDPQIAILSVTGPRVAAEVEEGPAPEEVVGGGEAAATTEE